MEPLVYGEVRDEHGAHQMRPRTSGHRLHAVVPVALEIQSTTELPPAEVNSGRRGQSEICLMCLLLLPIIQIRIISWGIFFGKHRNPPCKVKIPQRLCPRLLTDELRASLAVPILAPGASRADFRFEFCRMVVLLADTAHNSSDPAIPVLPLRKDGSAGLELQVLRSPDGSAAQV